MNPQSGTREDREDVIEEEEEEDHGEEADATGNQDSGPDPSQARMSNSDLNNNNRVDESRADPAAQKSRSKTTHQSPKNRKQPQQQQQQQQQYESNASLTQEPNSHHSSLDNLSEHVTPPDSANAYGMEDVSSNIRVVVRVRPFNELESTRSEERAVECEDDGRTLQVAKGPVDGNSGEDMMGNPVSKTRELRFDHVWGEEATQEVIFGESGVKDLVLQALNGYNATIFAYGQTGSGKTFTITGPEYGWESSKMFGIIPRSLQFLFRQIKASAGRLQSVTVRAAFLEIYNEQVMDLLNPGPALAVRWTQQKGFFVENLFIVECEVLDDCMAVLEEGLRNRTTGSHRLNEYSSRSHSIMTVYIDTTTRDSDDGEPVIRHGKISFVDLAGSEKVKESKATGDTLAETLNINKSLLTLGNCISALSDPQKRQSHVPFRDSKLTKLLSDSLGGTGLALMIACISPSYLNLQETLKTLRYALRAKRIRNKAKPKIDPVRDMVLQLKREVKGLQRENAELRARVAGTSRRGIVAVPAAPGSAPPQFPPPHRMNGDSNFIHGTRQIATVDSAALHHPPPMFPPIDHTRRSPSVHSQPQRFWQPMAPPRFGTQDIDAMTSPAFGGIMYPGTVPPIDPMRARFIPIYPHPDYFMGTPFQQPPSFISPAPPRMTSSQFAHRAKRASSAIHSEMRATNMGLDNIIPSKKTNRIRGANRAKVIAGAVDTASAKSRKSVTPTSREVKGQHRKTPTYQPDGPLQLETLHDVVSVRNWIIQDVEALDREIGRMKMR